MPGIFGIASFASSFASNPPIMRGSTIAPPIIAVSGFFTASGTVASTNTWSSRK